MGGLSPAELVNGYRIVGTLGKGGLGTTYEAVRESSGEHVALKRLAVAQVTDWKRFELFEREARVLSTLSHPAIPRYVEHFTIETAEGPALYLVQELVRGRSLADIATNGGVATDETEVRRIADALLRVLDYLGKQSPPVVHRDVKPENVLRRDDGTIVLVDFGAARADLAKPTGGSTTVGTYGYMAPEQLHGVASPATDIYGLACTLLFLLSGRSPAELPRKKLAIDFQSSIRVTPALASWLERALQPAPEDRFTSADAALSALHTGVVVLAAESKPRKAMRPLTWVLVGVLGCVIVGGGIFGAMTILQQRALARAQAQRPIKQAKGKELPALAPRWPKPHTYLPMPETRYIPAHMNFVTSTAMSPDGKLLVSTSRDASAKLWNPATGEPVRALLGHAGPVRGSAFSPDGARIYTASTGQVLVHDAKTGTLLATYEGDAQDMSTGLDLSKDGKRVSVISIKGAVRIWSTDTGAPLRKLDIGGEGFTVRFSPDGTKLATGGRDGVLKLWDPASGTLLLSLSGHTPGTAIDSIAWAPDGHVLVSTGDDHTVRFWHDAGGQLSVSDEPTDEVWSVAMDSRGKFIATASKDHHLRVYDGVQFKLVRDMYLGWDRFPTSVSWSTDEKSVVIGQSVGGIAFRSIDFKSRAPDVPPIPATMPATIPPTTPFDKATALISDYGGRSERLDQAEAILDEALKANPDDAMLHCGRAQLLATRAMRHSSDWDTKLLDASDAEVDRALALKPKLPRAHYQRARNLDHRASNKVKSAADANVDYRARAKEEAKLAAQLDPKWPAAQMLLAEFATESVELDDAETRVLALLPRLDKPRVEQAYSVLGDIYRRRGDDEALDVTFQRQLELAPAKAWLRGNYANFLASHGEPDRAIEMANSAIRIMDYGMAHHVIAHAYTRKGHARCGSSASRRLRASSSRKHWPRIPAMRGPTTASARTCGRRRLPRTTRRSSRDRRKSSMLR
jgi:tetratricopeptide (TPR) repeat protein/Tol biopolymer transport system component